MLYVKPQFIHPQDYFLCKTWVASAQLGFFIQHLNFSPNKLTILAGKRQLQALVKAKVPAECANGNRCRCCIMCCFWGEPHVLLLALHQLTSWNICFLLKNWTAFLKNIDYWPKKCLCCFAGKLFGLRCWYSPYVNDNRSWGPGIISSKPKSHKSGVSSSTSSLVKRCQKKKRSLFQAASSRLSIPSAHLVESSSQRQCYVRTDTTYLKEMISDCRHHHVVIRKSSSLCSHNSRYSHCSG